MSTFTLGVWRPIRFGRELYYKQQTAVGAECIIDDAPSTRLFEQVFIWSPDEEVWGGIVDETMREQLRSEFLDSFRYDLTPEARGLAALETFVEKLNTSGVPDTPAALVATSTVVRSGKTAGTNLWIPSSLALSRHLTWIVESFRGIPGISIVVH